MSENIKLFTDQNWETDVSNTEGLVIVDVRAPWCGPCRIVGPIIDELADDYSDQAVIGKLNADENSKSQALGGNWNSFHPIYAEWSRSRSSGWRCFLP